MNNRVKYWVELSDYDFETAEAMLTSGRYLYVGFMCHQTIEKIIKSYFSLKSDDVAPFSHNLSYLAEKSGLDDILSEEYRHFINLLEPLNIEVRYPTHKEELFKSLSKERCEEILVNTKKLQKWVKEKL